MLLTQKYTSKAFTLVELLIVIVVIGILVGLTTFGYGAWQKSTRIAQVKSDLTMAGTAMESSKNTSDTGYPSDIPNSIQASEGVQLSYYTGTASTFCINGTSTSDSTITFYIDNQILRTGPAVGTCASRSGDGTVASPSNVSVTNNGATIAVSWTAAAGAAKYEAVCATDQSFQDNVASATVNSPTVSANVAISAPGSYYCRVRTLTTNNASPWTSVAAAQKQGWLQVAIGHEHSCAIDSKNQAYCWGRNDFGQLGDNSTTNRTVPVKVVTSAQMTTNSFKQIEVGEKNSCGLGTNGNVYCWGHGGNSQLGNGGTANSSVPVAVSKLAGGLVNQTVSSIGLGNWHGCAATTSGQLFCWGYNINGQIGRSGASSSVPLSVNSGSLAGKRILRVTGGVFNTCALTTDGSVSCWGYGGAGQLGDGTTTVTQTTPVSVALPSGVRITALDSGYDHSCAVSVDGRAYCWGTNGTGKLGNNTTTQQNSPVSVVLTGSASGVRFVAVSGGGNHTCLLSDAGRSFCMGGNTNGALGTGSTSTSSNVPVATLATGALANLQLTSISAAPEFTCAVASDGQVYCWGLNTYGQLGTGSGTISSPTLVLNASGY